MKIINFGKKKMMPLTNEKCKSYLSQINCRICKKEFKPKYTNDNNFRIVKDHFYYKGKYRSAPHSICNLKYSMPTEIPVAFHNWLNCDHHFIRKKSLKENLIV